MDHSHPVESQPTDRRSFRFRPVWMPILVLILTACNQSPLEDESWQGDNFLYIGNQGYDEIFVVDTLTNEVVRPLTGFNCLITRLSGVSLSFNEYIKSLGR